MIYKGDALFKQVKQVYKCSLKTLIDTPEQHTSSELNNDNKAVYIFEPGLYQLLFSEKIPSCYLIHYAVLHGKFRKNELIVMRKSGFVEGKCVKH